MEESDEYFLDNYTDYSDPCNCTLKSNTTDDIYEFLECCLMPRRIQTAILIPVTVVYVVIFICGMLGNISVCVVIIKSSSLHTATNFYLFSLAISDLMLLLFGLPSELHTYWYQYPWTLGDTFCKARGMVAEMTNYASILTIVAFSLERYLAICHPLYAYTMAGLKRAIRIIALIWLISFFCSVPFAVHTEVYYRPYPGTTENMPESAFCGMMLVPQYLYEVSVTVSFILPMGILSVLYTLMGIRIRCAALIGHDYSKCVHKGDNKSLASRTVILRMLTAVVVGFFICWAPFHVQRLYFKYGFGVIEYEAFQTFNEGLFYIAGSFYFLSAVINPILYNVMSERYRLAFQETFCGAKDKRFRSSVDSNKEKRKYYSGKRSGSSKTHIEYQSPVSSPLLIKPREYIWEDDQGHIDHVPIRVGRVMTRYHQKFLTRIILEADQEPSRHKTRKKPIPGKVSNYLQ
ncbi:neuropeptides capa receptor-like isoform X2 [Artemia franciscana]|uniref:neuropeptides capa receptor-like isoform X2 n=1 Tax=Artemia franciscana TaxID=6661 RepID=UPI0032DB8818